MQTPTPSLYNSLPSVETERLWTAARYPREGQGRSFPLSEGDSLSDFPATKDLIIQRTLALVDDENEATTNRRPQAPPLFPLFQSLAARRAQLSADVPTTTDEVAPTSAEPSESDSPDTSEYSMSETSEEFSSPESVGDSTNVTDAESEADSDDDAMSISQSGRDAIEELGMVLFEETPARNVYPVQTIVDDHRWGWGRGSLRTFACKNLKPLTLTVVGSLKRSLFFDKSGEPVASVRLELVPLRSDDLKSARIVKMRLRSNLKEPADPSLLPNCISFVRQQPQDLCLPYFAFTKFSNVFDAPDAWIREPQLLHRIDPQSLQHEDIVMVYFHVHRGAYINFILHHIVRLYKAHDPLVEGLSTSIPSATLGVVRR